MKLLAQILAGIAAICLAVLAGIAVFAINSAKKERDMNRTAPMRAARHAKPEPTPEPTPEPEPTSTPPTEQPK